MISYTDLLPEQILITILRCLPLPADIKRQILGTLIHDLSSEGSLWYNHIYEKFWWYEDPEYYDDWIDIDN